MSDKPGILIVDDQETNLFLLKKIISRIENVEILSATDGNQALEKAAGRRFALAILDVHMPDMDGYELAENLKSDENFKDLPIIFLSAVYSDEFHIYKGYESGAVDFITKPFRDEILLSKVNTFLKLEEQRMEIEKRKDEFEKVARELEERESQYKTLFNSAQDAIFIFKDNVFNDCNPKSTEFFNCRKEEIIGKTPLDFSPEYQPDGMKSEEKVENIYKQVDKEELSRFEWLHNDAKGNEIYAEIILSTMIIRDTEYHFALCRDITKRKQLEEIHSRSEEQFRRVVESMPNAILFYSDGIIKYANIKAFDLLDVNKEEELIGTNIIDIVAPDSREEVSERIRTALEEGKTFENIEEILVTRLGIPFAVEISAMPFNFEGEDGILVLITNISERKRAEEEISKLSRAIEQSSSAVIITDKLFRIEYVNPAFTDTTEYEYVEVIGKKPSILRSGKTAESVYKELNESLKLGKSWRGEFLNKKKNGEMFWTIASITPVKNREGIVTHYVSVQEDITVRKNMENELRRAKETAEESARLKTSLLSNMSHEFRTPMNGILGYSVLLEESLDDEEHLTMVRKIHNSGNRLMSTLNSILELAHFESRINDANNEEVNIADITRITFNEFKRSVELKGLSYFLDIKDSDISIKCDPAVYARMLSNILDNAIKFTDTGSVTVKLEKAKENGKSFAVAEVIDTGIGIANKDIDIIFDEFRQVSEGLGRNYEGPGLGLTLSRKMVQMLGGSISVKSTPNEGSVFKIEIPIERDYIAEKHIEEVKHKDSKDQKEVKKLPSDTKPLVLLVEDNDINRDLIKFYLRKDYETDCAMDAETAIQMAMRKQYDVILMDINLGPGLTGLDAAREIKEIDDYKDIPFVAVTGYALKDDEKILLKEGFTKYLAKPFSEQQLLEVMQNLSVK